MPEGRCDQRRKRFITFMCGGGERFIFFTLAVRRIMVLRSTIVQDITVYVASILELAFEFKIIEVEIFPTNEIISHPERHHLSFALHIDNSSTFQLNFGSLRPQ